MAWIEWITFVSVVIAIFLEEGFCDDICPNGIINITGQTSGELEYPMAGTYGVNETKCWRIEIPKPYDSIGIILHRFEFEECLRCECDALSFASSYSFLEFLGDCERLSTRYLDFHTRLVGNRLYYIYTGENLYIRLKSDDSFNYRGFKFSYIVGSTAGGPQSYLNVSEGVISTPKFGSKNYPANFEWQWFLLAPEGHRINITFGEFELEHSENCKNDYLEIREAYFRILSYRIQEIRADYGAILARPTCGTNKPQDILSTGNMVWVHFKSDSNSTTTYKGFKATFTTSVGGRRSYLNVSEGEISTPKFGLKNHPANFEWQWFLLAPEGHQINITFSEFELEQSENCKNDYLEIREAYFAILSHPLAGIDAGYGAILARPTCGTNKPQSILSTGNMVSVHFKSDSNSTTRYKGFKATFTSGQARSFLVNNASTLLLLLLSYDNFCLKWLRQMTPFSFAQFAITYLSL